jgi:hypothetical protein
MKSSNSFRKAFTFAVISMFFSLSMQTAAFAGVIGNDQLAVQSAMQIQRNEVATFLAREDVRSSLLNAGVSATDVDTRVNNLSDSQVLQIHAQMDTLPAGGGVLGAILVIILIFILLDVAGVTDVFPSV